MLTIENARLSYGSSIALRGASLEIAADKITCVLGRNGVGKSSLLRSVIGQHPLSFGDVTFDGEDLISTPIHRRARSGIGFVPQGREIFPLLTVEENLQTGFSALPRKLRSIPDDIYELFPVLKDMLNRRGGDLSGGQQQQLAIARALITRPKVLLLDEPTEGIQPNIIQQIGNVIRILCEQGDMAIVLVEQFFDFAYDLGDDFTVMKRGEVSFHKRAKDLDRQTLFDAVMV